MRRICRHLTYANVMATLAVFLVLGGGTAIAAYVVSSNSQIAPNTIYGHRAPPDKNKNVVESSLSQVPSALLGGFGRSHGGSFCNPEISDGLLRCTVVTLDLQAQARVLLIGQATALREDDASQGYGRCEVVPFGTSSSSPTRAAVSVGTGQGLNPQNLSMVGITGAFPPGTHSFELRCQEVSGGIEFIQAGITAVAISPD
jgi:hypothetical protein